MRRIYFIGGVMLAAVVSASALAQRGAAPRPAAKAAPRLVPVAETKLLMEGLAHANFRGLEKLLKEKPADVETWTFARGQALLIAETGNLLMLRPPRNVAESMWMDRAGELRSKATSLARLLAAQEFDKSRASLSALAASCNACHASFKVKTRIAAFAEIREEE